MSRLMTRAGLVVVWVALLGLPAQAQDEPFKKGMDARGDRKWDLVISHMQEAIRINPSESSRKVGGGLFGGGNEYLPHFRLGEAFFNAKQCAQALDEWDESERQGVVQKIDRNVEVIQKGSAACESQGLLLAGKLASEAQRVDASIREAVAAEQSVLTFQKAHPDSSTAEYRSQAERGRGDLSAARTRLEFAKRSRRASEMTEAAMLAENSKRAYVDARSAIEKAVVDLERFGSKLRDVQRTIDEADQTAQAVAALVASSPLRGSVPSGLADARRKAEDSLTSAKDKVGVARKTRDESDIAEANRVALDAQLAYARVHSEVEKVRKNSLDGESRGLRASANDAFAAIESRVSRTRELLVASPPSREVGDRVETALKTAVRTVARIRKQFDEAMETGNLSAARVATRAALDVNAQLDAVSPLIVAPAVVSVIPDVLRQGAQQFFEGRYREALNSLRSDATAPLSAELRVHAHLLRSASWFALYEYSGRREQSLLTSARQDAEACKRLDQSFRPDPSAFAPKFLEFFAKAASQ
jgi:hypothetical protein